MRIAPAGDGARIRLNLAESHVLEQLLTELQAELAPGALDAADPVHQRLYPVGYADDDKAALDFRELTEDTLRTERTARVDTCVAEVRAGRSMLRTDVTLDADGAQRWLRVTNDLRLIFGIRLGITDDADTDDAAMAASLTGELDGAVDGAGEGAAEGAADNAVEGAVEGAADNAADGGLAGNGDDNRAVARSQLHIRARYLWLTSFQDALVTTLMG